MRISTYCKSKENFPHHTRVHIKVALKTQREVKTYVKRNTVLRVATVHAVKRESIVMGICEILAPNVQLQIFGNFQSDIRAQHCVKVLRETVGLLPIDITGAVHILSKAHSTQYI